MCRSLRHALIISLMMPASLLAVEPNTDRPGLDYYSFALRTPDAELCLQTCDGDSRCMAWTYVKPGITGPRAECRLKYDVPRAYNSNCCVSGLKEQHITQPSAPVAVPSTVE